MPVLQARYREALNHSLRNGYKTCGWLSVDASFVARW